jgi:hypothetical protein
MMDLTLGLNGLSQDSRPRKWTALAESRRAGEVFVKMPQCLGYPVFVLIQM